MNRMFGGVIRNEKRLASCYFIQLEWGGVGPRFLFPPNPDVIPYEMLRWRPAFPVRMYGSNAINITINQVLGPAT